MRLEIIKALMYALCAEAQELEPLITICLNRIIQNGLFIRKISSQLVIVTQKEVLPLKGIHRIKK